MSGMIDHVKQSTHKYTKYFTTSDQEKHVKCIEQDKVCTFGLHQVFLDIPAPSDFYQELQMEDVGLSALHCLQL